MYHYQKVPFLPLPIFSLHNIWTVNTLYIMFLLFLSVFMVRFPLSHIKQYLNMEHSSNACVLVYLIFSHVRKTSVLSLPQYFSTFPPSFTPSLHLAFLLYTLSHSLIIALLSLTGKSWWGFFFLNEIRAAVSCDLVMWSASALISCLQCCNWITRNSN